MLEKLEENAEAKVVVEAKVTGTVRRASVLVDPARVGAEMEELKEADLPTEAASKVVNELWTKRSQRREYPSPSSASGAVSVVGRKR